MEKIVLGLSGGVDSAVAAYLLKNRGFDVFGLYLDIGNEGGAADARNAAEALDIPLKVLDIKDRLDEFVCLPFIDAYLRGETPNPCVNCNPLVKFKSLIGYADEIGAGLVATGHYARAEGGGLYKGHPENDQSYMLSRLTIEQLNRLCLPLGPYSKAEVRKMAGGFGLPMHSKPASMEICFIPGQDYGKFIESKTLVPGEGNFVDNKGNILGRHKGIHRYTIGQRRGLGIAAGRRVFVSEIRPEENEVVLSDGPDLYVDKIRVRDINWLIDRPDASFNCDVRVRHSKNETPAVVLPEEGGAAVIFEAPVRAPTAGQSAVFYDGDRVLGGGFILRPSGNI